MDIIYIHNTTLSIKQTHETPHENLKKNGVCHACLRFEVRSLDFKDAQK